MYNADTIQATVHSATYESAHVYGSSNIHTHTCQCEGFQMRQSDGVLIKSGGCIWEMSLNAHLIQFHVSTQESNTCMKGRGHSVTQPCHA